MTSASSQAAPNPSWSSRSDVISECVHELLIAAKSAASGDLEGTSRLSTAAANFDTAAGTLEADLVRVAQNARPRTRPMPTKLIHSLAEREQLAAR